MIVESETYIICRFCLYDKCLHIKVRKIILISAFESGKKFKKILYLVTPGDVFFNLKYVIFMI